MRSCDSMGTRPEDRTAKSFEAWHFLRGMAGMVTLVLTAGCAWLWPSPPQTEPEREPVQYSFAPLPVQEPAKEAVQPPTAPAPQTKTTRDEVTILPKKDGSIGGVVVQSNGVEVLLDKAYASALVEGPGMVTESTYDPELATRNFAEVLAVLPAEPVKFLLYFLEGTDELTVQSQEEIERVFADLKTRPAPEILVIGHTDAVGTSQFNDKLSLQRAERVRADLVQRGIPQDSILATGRGKRELLLPTEDGVSEPQNRRVEINVR